MTKEEFTRRNASDIKTYDFLHSKLRRQNGNANKCVHCKVTGKKRYQWALIEGRKYSLDIKDYIELCVSCHKKYDMTDLNRENMSKATKGISIDWPKKKVILNDVEFFNSVVEGAIAKGICKTSISNNLSGRSKKTSVGVWKYNKNDL